MSDLHPDSFWPHAVARWRLNSHSINHSVVLSICGGGGWSSLALIPSVFAIIDLRWFLLLQKFHMHCSLFNPYTEGRYGTMGIVSVSSRDKGCGFLLPTPPPIPIHQSSLAPIYTLPEQSCVRYRIVFMGEVDCPSACCVATKHTHNNIHPMAVIPIPRSAV